MNLKFNRNLRSVFFLLFILAGALSCKKSVRQQEDELYSRHLQRKVKLTVISTPIPNQNDDIHLLICNDGGLLNKLDIKFITDSLHKKKQLPALVIVGVHPANRLEEYGIGEQSGKSAAGGKADHYDSFINNELYPYAKKNAGVRKFKSVVMAGFGAGGLSALDLAWSHPDKISKAGIFSGAFSRKLKNVPDTSVNGMMLEKLKVSRKRPNLQYWLYAGSSGNTDIAGDDGKDIYAATNSVVELLRNKSFTTDDDITFVTGLTNDSKAWRQQFPGFLVWAFGGQ